MSNALPIHPVTGLTALAIGKRGPIWPQLGGSGDGDGNTGDTPPAAGAGSGDAGTGSGTGAGGAGTGDAGTGNGDASKASEPAATGDPKPGSGEVPKPTSTASDPKTREARRQAREAEAKFDKLREAIGQALGFTPEEAETDPVKLAAKLDTATKEARESKAELSVFRTAPKDVDAQALVDSRAFTSKLHALDQSADDYDDQVKSLISEFADKSPSKFKLTPAAAAAPPAPSKSGADPSTGKGEDGGQLTYEQYKAMSPSERVKAVKDGRADRILGRSK